MGYVSFREGIPKNMQSTNSRTLILILISKFFGKKTYQLSCLFRARLIETYFECWIHSLNVSDLPLTRKSPKKIHWQSPKGYIYLYAYRYIYIDTYVHNNDIYATLQYTKLILLFGSKNPLQIPLASGLLSQVAICCNGFVELLQALVVC